MQARREKMAAGQATFVLLAELKARDHQ